MVLPSASDSHRSDSTSARRASRRSPGQPRRVAARPPPRDARRGLGSHVVEMRRAASGAASLADGVGHRELAVVGDRVEAPARPVLVGGNLRVFPDTRHQPHLLETAERPVEGPVGGEQFRVARVLQLFRDEVAVEGFDAARAQGHGGRADSQLEGHQRPGFPAHGVNMQISAYKVNRVLQGIMCGRVAPAGRSPNQLSRRAERHVPRVRMCLRRHRRHACAMAASSRPRNACVLGADWFGDGQAPARARGGRANRFDRRGACRGRWRGRRRDPSARLPGARPDVRGAARGRRAGRCDRCRARHGHLRHGVGHHPRGAGARPGVRHSRRGTAPRGRRRVVGHRSRTQVSPLRRAVRAAPDRPARARRARVENGAVGGRGRGAGAGRCGSALRPAARGRNRDAHRAARAASCGGAGRRKRRGGARRSARSRNLGACARAGVSARGGTLRVDRGRRRARARRGPGPRIRRGSRRSSRSRRRSTDPRAAP